MRFDNAEFERKSKQTVSTLEKLKSALNFDNSAKSMNALQDSVDDMNFSPLEKGLDAVGQKFNWLDQIAIGALRRIGDQLVNTTERMVKGLSVDQVSAGWNKYAEKAASVQTIVNATGKSVDEVGEYLKKLMWFSDETSFSFTSMTQSLSTMLSTGGDIDKLTPLITGIANATAYAGKSNSEFQRSIFNLSQSYGQGYLSLMDWRSVMNAGVNSEALINKFIEVGEALGKIKEGTVSLGNFSDTLKDKWVDRDVMEKAFGDFAEFSEALYEMQQDHLIENAAEGIELYGDQFDELAVKAFSAGQEAKSFSEAVDAVKDAVSSGWMETFEIILGNYEESKALWATLYDGFWDIFASGTSDRNALLQDAFGLNAIVEYGVTVDDLADGIANLTENLEDAGIPLEEIEDALVSMTGREYLFDAISALFEAYSTLTGAVKDAWDEVVEPITAGWIYSLLRSFDEFANSLILTEESAEKVKNAFSGIFVVVDILRSVLGVVAKIAAKALSLLTGVADIVLTVIGLIGNLASSIYTSVKSFGVFGALLEAVFASASGIIDSLSFALYAFNDSVSMIAESPVFLIITDFLSSIGNAAMYAVGGIAAVSQLLVGKLVGGLTDTEYATEGVYSAFEFLGEGFGTFLYGIETFLDKLLASEGVKMLTASLLDLKDVVEYAFGSVLSLFPKFGQKLGEIFGNGQKIESFGDILISVISGVANALSVAIDLFTGGLIGGISIIQGLSKDFATVWNTILSFFGKGTSDGIATIGDRFGALGDKIVEVEDKIRNLGLIGAIADTFKGLTGGLVDFSGAVQRIFLPALDKLKEMFGGEEAALNLIGLIELIGLIVMLRRVASVFDDLELEKISKKFRDVLDSFAGFLNGLKFSVILKAIGSLLLSVSVSIGIFAASIAVLAKVFENNSSGLLLSTGIIIALIVLISKLANNIANMDIKNGAVSLVAMSGYLLSLAATVAILGKAQGLKRAIGAITSISLVLGVFVGVLTILDDVSSKAAGVGKASGAFNKIVLTILEFSAAVVVLAHVAKTLGALSSGQLISGTLAVIGLMVSLTAITEVMSNMNDLASAKVGASGVGFLAMAAGVMVLVKAFQQLATVPILDVNKTSAWASKGLLPAVAALALLTVCLRGLAPAFRDTAPAIWAFVAAYAAVALLTPKIIDSFSGDNASKIGAAIGNIIGSLFKIIRTIGMFVAAIITLPMYVPEIIPVYAAAGSALLAFGGIVGEFIKGFSNNVKNIGIGVALLVGGALLVAALGEQIGNGLIILVQTLCKIIAATAGPIAETILTVIDEILKAIANHVESIVDSIISIVWAVVVAIGDRIKDPIHWLIDQVSALNPFRWSFSVTRVIDDETGEAKYNLEKKSPEQRRKEKEAAIEREKKRQSISSGELDASTISIFKNTEAITNNTQAVKDNADAREDAKTKYTDVGATVSQVLGAYENFEIGKESAQNSLQSIFATLGDQAAPMLNNMLEQYGPQLENLLGDFMKEIGGDSVAGFVEGQNENVDKVAESSENLGTSGVIEPLKESLDSNSPSKKTKEIGVWAVEGLKIGLENSGLDADIYNASYNLGQIVLNGLTDSLDIHSPSDETHEKGEYAVKGFYLALEEGEGDVVDATYRLAEAAIAELAEKQKYYESVGEASAAMYAKGITKGFKVLEGTFTPMGNLFDSRSTVERIRDKTAADIAAGNAEYERKTAQAQTIANIRAKRAADIAIGNAKVEAAKAPEHNSLLDKWVQTGKDLVSDFVDDVTNGVDEVFGGGSGSGGRGSSGSGGGSSKTLAESIRERYEKQLDELSNNQQIKDLQYELWKLAYGEDASNKEWQEKYTENLASKIETQTKRVELAQKEYAEILKSYNETSTEAVEANNRLLNEQIELQSLKNSLHDDFDQVIRERYEKQLDDLSNSQQIKDLQYELWQLAYGEDASNKDWQEKHSENLASKIEMQTKRVELAQKEYADILKSYDETSREAVEANNRLLNEQIELQSLRNSLKDDFEADIQHIVDKFEKDFDKIDVAGRIADSEEEKWTALYGDSAKASDIASRKSTAYTKRLARQEERVAKVYAEYQEIADKLGKESITAQKYYANYLAEQNNLYELQKQSEELADEVAELVSKRYQKSYDAISNAAQNRDAYVDLHNSLVGDEAKQIEKQQKIFDKASEAYNEAVERYGKYSEEAANARKKLNVERDKLKKLKKEDEESEAKREKFEGKLTASELTEAYRDLYDDSKKASLAREYYNEMVRAYGKDSKQAGEAYRQFAEYQTDFIDQMQVILDNYDMDPTAKTVINNLSTLLIENKEGVGKAAKAIGKSIAKNVNLPENMKEALKGLGKFFGSESTQNILVDALTMAGHLEAGEVAAAVNDGFSIFSTLIDSKLGQEISWRVVNAISKAFSSGSLSEAMGEIGTLISGAFGSGGLGKALTFITTSLANIFGGGGLISTIVGAIGTFISGLGASLSGIVATIGGFLATLGGPGILAIVAAVAGIGTLLLGAFDGDFFKKIFEVGKNIVTGLVKGIMSFAMTPVQAIVNIGKGIVNGFKSFFGIHSPSKLFDGLGHFLMMGLGNGIEDETTDVVDTVKAASTSIAETVSRAVDIANGVIENPYANQPTIRPIMDMSAIEEGRVTLAEMMSSGEAVRFSADTSMNFSENASLAIADMLELQNERVIGELRLMRDDLFAMSEQFAAGINAITNMQVVLGSGELVGGIGGGMNEYLGMQTVLDWRNV